MTSVMQSEAEAKELEVERVSQPSRASSVQGESYQYTQRFSTWRKHVRDLYQQMLHVDLVWESPVAQLMPYATVKDGLTSHTILAGTRTGGQEQCYLQLLTTTTPSSTAALDAAVPAYSEVSGEVGGYGLAPHQSGLKIERRIAHNGDVLAARYMYANPLLIASASSDGNVYVFDWSRVSLNKFPNDPPRPRAPLPPNELSADCTAEERAEHQKRMRALNAVAVEQDRWDRRTAEGQHLLCLKGGEGPSDNLDWSITADGMLASGSQGQVSVWQVGHLSKDDVRTVEPLQKIQLDQDEGRVSAVQFSWSTPQALLCGSTSGSAYYIDTRAGEPTEVFSIPAAMSSLALSPLDSASVLVGGSDGGVSFFDLRRSVQPVSVARLHAEEVTALQWCPHSPHLFASGGGDGIVSLYNMARQKVLFRHAGHTDGIMDLGWNWQEHEAGQLVSVDANALTLWRPRDYFFCR